MSTEIATQKQHFSLAPKDLDEAMRFADMLASASMKVCAHMPRSAASRAPQPAGKKKKATWGAPKKA